MKHFGTGFLLRKIQCKLPRLGQMLPQSGQILLGIPYYIAETSPRKIIGSRMEVGVF